MKITVLGCGAVGRIWLSTLLKHGHDVQGWLRTPQKKFNVHTISKDGNVFSNELVTTNDFDFLANSDLLIVTLKAWQVSDAVKTLTLILPCRSPILLLHNGIGTIDELKDITQPIIIGTTTHAAKHEGGAVIHIAKGVTHIGPANKKLKNDYNSSYLTHVLNVALPDVIWHDDMKLHLWKKLAINCVINPLTVLWNCSNGVLQNHLQEVSILCEEFTKVSKCEGLDISKENLFSHVKQIIFKTSENISSMLQDIRASRRTEIDYITGYFIGRARSYGISVPENIRLYMLVKRKERECRLHH